MQIIMLIDSHVHFWNFDKKNDAWITNNMKILQQDFLPVNILPTLQEAGVNGLVAVQAGQSETETNFLLSLAQTNSFINGVVGWVDLQNETVEDRLNYYAQFTAIKGWRHIIQAEAEGFLSGKNFIKGIAQLQLFNYTYDILVYQHQLKEVLELVQKFPNQKFVIDHCAKPDIKNKSIEPWKTLIKEIASNPNVYCKLSGFPRLILILVCMIAADLAWSQAQPTGLTTVVWNRDTLDFGVIEEGAILRKHRSIGRFCLPCGLH